MEGIKEFLAIGCALTIYNLKEEKNDVVATSIVKDMQRSVLLLYMLLVDTKQNFAEISKEIENLIPDILYSDKEAERIVQFLKEKLDENIAQKIVFGIANMTPYRTIWESFRDAYYIVFNKNPNIQIFQIIKEDK